MDADMYSIFCFSTPNVQIKINRLDSVDKATPGRRSAKSSLKPKRVLCDVTNKIPDLLECHLSPLAGCEKIQNGNVSPFRDLTKSPISQSGRKRVLSDLRSPLNEIVTGQSPLSRRQRSIVELATPLIWQKKCKSDQSGRKKVIRYLGSPCSNFTIYNGNTDERSDVKSCTSIDTAVSSEYEDDVFLKNSDSVRIATNVQINDSFENDDEEGPWLPRKFFSDIEEMHTLLRADVQPNLEKHSLVLPISPVPSTRWSIGLSPLNISCGLLPSPKLQI